MGHQVKFANKSLYFEISSKNTGFQKLVFNQIEQFLNNISKYKHNKKLMMQQHLYC